MSQSKSNLFLAAFHAAGFAWMYYGLHSLDQLDMNEFVSKQYGGHAQYLTIQGLVISLITVFLAAINDVAPGVPLIPSLKKFFLLVSLPLESVIATIYWSLRLFIPHLILPSTDHFAEAGVSDSPEVSSPKLFYIPLPMDLAMHAAPGIILLLHFFLFEKKFSLKEVRQTAAVSILAFALWYGPWVEWCASYNNNKFPYPFLPEDSLPIRFTIYAGAALFAFISLQGINALHS
ncbi:FAR-17a/AIG1-like protein [Flagelloscypha sp. PMI_526]|nr:FAR-17a/AIG1-like protein [Flagelloscypha sp. PMI_526]